MAGAAEVPARAGAVDAAGLRLRRHRGGADGGRARGDHLGPDQFYSAEQWRTKTGESIDSDFRIVNESTRTRQFVVEDDAVIYVNVQYGETGEPVRLTPQQFVDRTNAALVDQAVGRREPASGPGTSPDDVPSVRVFLFHSDRLDGTVGYVEDVGMYTG